MGPAMFSFSTAGGDATPFGTYGDAINSTAHNGSVGGFFGDLNFTITRTSGLSTDDFITNADGYYFAADLAGPTGLTGSQAWQLRTEQSVPDGGSAIALLGMGLMGIEGLRRKFRS